MKWYVLYMYLLDSFWLCVQMQSTICEHRDDGRAGGVFRAYEIVKVDYIGPEYSILCVYVARFVNPVFGGSLALLSLDLSCVQMNCYHHD